MADLVVQNATRGTTLASRARHADTIWTRLVGLLGTSGLGEGAGLVLEPCNGVHMWWMKYALDVVFADVEGQVVGVVAELRPWRVSKVFRGARYAIELPVGAIAASGTEVGDRLVLEPV
jgi:uncharacterized membrane protein (UPF0127 family)